MATYYFDANGATAGFGTLTGNWNPSTALWSTNSAGTSATSAVTFTNADVAQFGFAGTTGTAGTATITTGITNTVNQVVTANLAGLQTIAGPGTLDLAGTTPTINVGSAGGLTISAPITGTAGFTKAGTGRLAVTNTGNTLSGTITNGADINTGYMAWGGAAQSGNVFPNVTAVVLNGGVNAPLIIDSNTAYTHPATFTGAGSLLVSNTAAGGITFAAGALGGMTGTGATTVGFASYPKTGQLSSYVNVNDFPAGRAGWVLSGASPAGYLKFVGTTGTHQNYTTDLYIDTVIGGLVSGTPVIELYANGSAGSSFKLSGNVTRSGTNITAATLTLRGTNSNDNELSGNITNFSAGFTLGITKADAGRWILSGTSSTYTGANTVSAGTLVANNNAALGAASGTASSITTGATLEIGSGITVNKASTAFTLNGNTAANGAIYAPAGNAGLTASGFTLGTATTDIKADAGATLTLTSAGAIGGNFTLRHIGAGTAVLAQTAASTFTALNIQSGTVSVSAALAAGGTASGIGNGSTAAANWLIGSTASAGTFRYTGAASSSNRNFTIGTAGSTFDASGSGVLTLTGTTPAFSAANTACTLTLAGMAGTSAAPNTSAMVLANNGTGAVALTKTGVGAWELSASQTYTGTTTVTGGSLAFSENNISTDVTFNGPGTLRKVVLNGVSKTITCAAGASDVAELVATSSHNTITGSTNITTGTLKLTTEAFAAGKPVKVAGDTNVSVTSKLQTSTGILQRGQMRYGGDLTFQAGSTFIIGG